MSSPDRTRFLLLLLLTAPGTLSAQDSKRSPPGPVKPVPVLQLFLDCRAVGCDFDFLRTDLDWVNYVRDRTDAQVHVIATSLSTASGGSEVTLAFMGQGAFAGINDEVKYPIPQGASSADQRQELSRVLKIGLSRYLLRLVPGGGSGAFSYRQSQARGPLSNGRDPWNFWVFSAGISGGLDGESRSRSASGSGNLSASRTTADWKLRLGMSGNSDRSSFELDDGSTYVARSHSYYVSALLVRSLGDHFSLGGTADASSLSRQNLDFSMRIAPTMEYDFFKYDQYSRRRLVASYSVGLDRYVYTDTTIYNRMRETRFDQMVSLSYATTQPWGRASAGIDGFLYLSEARQNRVSLYTSVSLRVTRGLQVSYSLSYSRVRDQIALAKGSASEAEILLRLRQLATNYTYGGYLSLSYTFGSLFNNVVNPRMGSSGS
jgi:hypothetical protein